MRTYTQTKYKDKKKSLTFTTFLLRTAIHLSAALCHEFLSVLNIIAIFVMDIDRGAVSWSKFYQLTSKKPVFAFRWSNNYQLTARCEYVLNSNFKVKSNR